MPKLLPEVSKLIRSNDIREIIEKNFVSIMPVWAPLQLPWVNGVYKTFHDYEKFIKPSELAGWIRNSNLTSKETIGLSYNPITDKYWLGKDIQVNYMVHAKKEELE